MEARIVTLDTTDSTNRTAFTMASEGAGHGSSVIAREQTGGRGRLGKRWHSPVGRGLYCSIIVRPRISPEDFPLLTMTAGLATALGLDKITDVRFGLKWPNDIYRRGKKCGGILVESSPLLDPEENHFAVVGIGINVDVKTDEFEPDIRKRATSLYLECGRSIDKQNLFETIHQELLGKVSMLEQEGFGSILDHWKKKDILVDSRLDWVNVKGEKVSGVSLGPDDRGRLHIRDDSSHVHEVISGDIRLVDADSTLEGDPIKQGMREC